MTTSAPTITFDNTSDATFRAWGLAISTALQAVGLTKTTDTGQIDFTTVLTPGTANLARGYEMYRLTDSLNATKPVFMKIEYGSGSAATYPGVWITFSNLTNGAGTLTGLLTCTRKQHFGVGSATGQPCYFASDGSYLTMLLAPALYTSNASGFFLMVLLFDRSRDSAGAITNDGFHYFSTQAQASSVVQRYNAQQFGFAGVGANFISYASSGMFSFRLNARGETGDIAGNTSQYGFGGVFVQSPLNPGTSTYLGDTYFWPQLVTFPNVSYSHLLLAGLSGDLPANLTTISVTALGAAHTYLAMGIDVTGYGGAVRTLVRYE